MPEKNNYICQRCKKLYKRKSCFDKHVKKCNDKELEEFNLEGLIEHWKDIDPIIANCFEVELKKLQKNEH